MTLDALLSRDAGEQRWLNLARSYEFAEHLAGAPYRHPVLARPPCGSDWNIVKYLRVACVMDAPAAVARP
jgi:hypothetical protein